MTMKPWRTWLVVWMMAWLPLSGALAAVMPLQAIAPIQASGTGILDEALPMPCHAAQGHQSVPASGNCEHCELCHLVNALIAAAAMRVETGAQHALDFAAAPMSFASHIPELPQRPPSISLD